MKAIGDAGLFAFLSEDTDNAVLALRNVQHRGDAYLSKNGYKGRGIFKMHCGPVASGPLGAPGNKPFDVIVDTVNIAATLEAVGFAMTPQVFRALKPETRKLFKKHTLPVTYIGLDDKHRT